MISHSFRTIIFQLDNSEFQQTETKFKISLNDTKSLFDAVDVDVDADDVVVDADDTDDVDVLDAVDVDVDDGPLESVFYRFKSKFRKHSWTFYFIKTLT